MSDLIDRQKAINVIERMRAYIGHNMERAVCAAFIEILDDVGEDIGRLPSIQFATDTNVGNKLVIDPHKIERAIRGLTEWQKHVQTESDIDRDISVAVEALKAQLGTNLAQLGTDCISRQAAIDAFGLSEKTRKYGGDHSGYDTRMLYEIQDVLEGLPPAEPKRGRWIKLDMHRGMADHKCSVCKQECYVPTCMGEPMYAFCPNCGAKMEVTE